MSINTTPTAIVTLNGEPYKFVEDLGSLISKDSGADEDIKAGLGKARCVFVKLQNISKFKQFTMRKYDGALVGQGTGRSETHNPV